MHTWWFSVVHSLQKTMPLLEETIKNCCLSRAETYSGNFSSDLQSLQLKEHVFSSSIWAWSASMFTLLQQNNKCGLRCMFLIVSCCLFLTFWQSNIELSHYQYRIDLSFTESMNSYQNKIKITFNSIGVINLVVVFKYIQQLILNQKMHQINQLYIENNVKSSTITICS